MNPRTRRLLLLTSSVLLRGFLRRNTHWLARLSFVVIPLVLACAMLLAFFTWESDTAVTPPREPALCGDGLCP
jgi:hypothetical protein